MTETTTELYQGWANHETWAAHLHITNTQESYNAALAMAAEAKEKALLNSADGIWTLEEAAKYTLADALKEWVYDEVIENCPEDSSFGGLLRLDLLTSAFEGIDWHEIADAFLIDD